MTRMLLSDLLGARVVDADGHAVPGRVLDLAARRPAGDAADAGPGGTWDAVELHVGGLLVRLGIRAARRVPMSSVATVRDRRVTLTH